MSTTNIIFFILSIFLIVWSKVSKKNIKENKINKNINIFIDKYYKYIIILLFILIIFTSTYKLGEVPYGLNVDEAGMAYDALSMANFKVDRTLNKYPIYFVNFGGGQSVMYGYLTMLLIKIFGYSKIIIRLPIVILRILLSICCFLIIKSENNKIKNIILLLLLAICPYFIMQSRWGLDCNLLVGFTTISIYLLYKSLKNDNNIILFLSGILFGLTLYTYALSYLIIPIFLLITFIYLIYIKKINIKKIIIFSIPLAILALPLILLIMVNNNIIDQINTFITIPKLPNYRGKEISIKNIFNNLYIFKSILTFDNPKIFGNMLVYNATKEFGTIYYFTITFTIIGFISSFRNSIKAIKNKTFDTNVIFTALFISVIIIQLIIENPNINKSNAIFISIIYFSTEGIIKIINHKKYIIIPITIILFINFISFSNYYFNKYNSDNMDQYVFATHYLDALNFSESLNKKYIYLEKQLTSQQYIYILLENQISPYKYNTNEIKVKNTTYITSIPEDVKINNDSAFILRRYAKPIQEKVKELNFNKKYFGDIIVYYK